MKSLSVAIAAYNEEDQIGTCLDSVREWVDEIVLVDGGSTDRTVEIAKKKGARVLQTDNPAMFHINKQKAIDSCKGEWILQLDADEVVTPDLKDEIMLVVDQRPTIKDQRPINGYWIPRKNYFLGRFLMKGGQYPDYTLRFYRKGKGRLPCKSVHEQAVVEEETAYLTQPLLHYSYPSFSHYLEHFNLYTDIFSQELLDEKTPISPVSFFDYFVLKPKIWFLKTYIRHKGFQDGFPGFVFSLFSALRFPVSYVKYWEKESESLRRH